MLHLRMSKEVGFSREELIQLVKYCGQLIIDNAESVVGNYEFQEQITATMCIKLNEMPKIFIQHDISTDEFIDNKLPN